MERDSLLKLWDESWEDGIWFGSWSRALANLTPAQAAWQPKPGKHSIWQLVNHVVFWREVTVDLLAGRPRPSRAESERRNFEASAEPTAAAWDAARAALERSHRAIREAIADERHPLDRLRYHLAHDANHLGQMLYLRSLMDLPVIEA
jgi:hypothetical protein